MFELFFKYSRATFERAELVLASGWPLWLLVVLAIFGGAAIAFTLIRNRRGLPGGQLAVLGFLQLAVLVTALIMLWQPALVTQTLRPEDNSVALLIDNSISMRYGEGDATRLQQAVAAVNQDILPQLAESLTIDTYTFSESPTQVTTLEDIAAIGNVTHIGTSLVNVLQGANAGALAAVVLLSDGADNEADFDAALIAEIASFGVPVHTVGIGREVLTEDVELEDVVIAPQGPAGSTASAQVSIRHGQAGIAQLKVYDGDSILASEAIVLPDRNGVTTRQIDLEIGDAGVRDLRFTLDALPGERNVLNNTQLRPVEVPEQRRSILYIEGEPRWEYKFMRRAIDDDVPLRLASLLRTTPNKFYRQGIESPDELVDGFPTDEATLFKYDALVIGSYEAAALTEAQHNMIREFVSRRGGSLLMLGGRRGLGDGGWGITSVAEVLPVTLPDRGEPSFIRTPATVRLTASGERALLARFDSDDAANQAAWAALPELADFQYVGELKPGADTLLEATVRGEVQPLLIQQRFGLGGVYVLASGGTWRWQMQMPHEDLHHETFWRQLLQALVTGAAQRMTLTSDRPFYADQQRVVLRAELRNEIFEPAVDAQVSVTATHASGVDETIEMRPVAGEPGVYEAQYIAALPGVYRFEATAENTAAGEAASLTEASTDVLVGAAAEGPITGADPADVTGQNIAEAGTEFAAAAGADAFTARVAIRREDGVAEQFRQAQNRGLLERISAATGGRYFTRDDLGNLGEAISFSEAGVVERQLLELWNMPIFFFLLLIFKGSEWLLRLRWGRL